MFLYFTDAYTRTHTLEALIDMYAGEIVDCLACALNTLRAHMMKLLVWLLTRAHRRAGGTRRPFVLWLRAVIEFSSTAECVRTGRDG